MYSKLIPCSKSGFDGRIRIIKNDAAGELAAHLREQFAHAPCELDSTLDTTPK